MRISLNEIKLNPDLKKGMHGKPVFIWSNEHKMWWKPNAAGYTDDRSMAGVYKFEEALSASFHAGPEKEIWYEPLLDKPIVVCLCGSTRFKEAFEKALRDETLGGKIVLSVGLFGHLEGLDMNGETKKMLDNLHLRKIDLADEILVINVGGYIGESTSREIKYATVKGKRIRYLENLTD